MKACNFHGTTLVQTFVCTSPHLNHSISNAYLCNGRTRSNLLICAQDVQRTAQGRVISEIPYCLSPYGSSLKKVNRLLFLSALLIYYSLIITYHFVFVNSLNITLFYSCSKHIYNFSANYWTSLEIYVIILCIYNVYGGL